MSRQAHSRDAFSSTHLRFSRLYNSYRMWTKGHFQSHRNNIALPFGYSMVWADVSRKMNTTFDTSDVIDVIGYGQEDAAVARKNKVLLNAQLKDAKGYQRFIDLVTMGDIYGTAFMQWGWRFEERELIQRLQTPSPVTGRLIESLKTENRITFDGPDLRTWDPLDCFPQPNVTEIDEMGWFCVEYTMDLDEVMMLSQAGEDGQDGVFDRSAARRLELMGDMRRHGHDHAGQDAAAFRHGNEITNTGKQERYARPIRLTEMWGRVPPEFAPAGEDNDTNPIYRVITVANGQVVLRDRPNPYNSGDIPFLAYRTLPDPHFLFSPGKIEMIEKLQWAASRLASQKLDVLELFADPAFYVNMDSEVETRNMTLKPGRLFFGRGPYSEAMSPISPDLRGMQNIYTEIDSLNQMIQRASAITDDTVQGLGGGSSQTAREFVGRQENVSVRLLLESRILEETVLEPLIRQWIGLNKQFLETPREMRMLGKSMINPRTGELLPSEEQRMFAEDLHLDYDVVALGSTNAVSKSIRQQNWVMLMQMVNANPLAAGLVNQLQFWRETFRVFDIQNTDELLQVPEEQEAAMQKLFEMGAFGKQQGPGGAGSPSGGNRSNTPAEIGDANTLSPIGGLEGINASL